MQVNVHTFSIEESGSLGAKVRKGLSDCQGNIEKMRKRDTGNAGGNSGLTRKEFLTNSLTGAVTLMVKPSLDLIDRQAGCI